MNPDLFDGFTVRDPPAQRHSRTSIAAAKSIKKALAPLQARVIGYLRECAAGATDEQMATALNMQGNTLRPRRIELQERGFIRDSGLTLKTKAGRSAVVWIATNKRM